MMAADSALVTPRWRRPRTACRPPRRSRKAAEPHVPPWPDSRIPRWRRGRRICGRSRGGPGSWPTVVAGDPPCRIDRGGRGSRPGGRRRMGDGWSPASCWRAAPHRARRDRGPLAGDPARDRRGRGGARRSHRRGDRRRRRPRAGDPADGGRHPRASWTDAIERAASRGCERGRAERLEPAVTTDGRGGAPAGERRHAWPRSRRRSQAGAEGIGLLRTELAFLEAHGWPSEAAHVAALEPMLAPLANRVATVRTLDFGGDKTPPFLRGSGAQSMLGPRGIRAGAGPSRRGAGTAAAGAPAGVGGHDSCGSWCRW